MEYNKFVSAFAAVAITAGAFALVSSPAFAKDRPVLVVADQQTLKHRVSRGINSLCSESTGGQDGFYVTSFARMKCGRIAWSQARPQMANAAQRARDIALTGTSTIAAVAITIDLSK